ncbi:hypothetical protein GW756_05815 [bacterium]|nr:hypothetical protein [bacterium]NCQ55936.1 hypothetical protein [Candidatus Parcubacteria bacterium]NCS67961.1 hypothetical protein [Candidatus Peregrinibacteria bacterium]NCS96855.1 hypothetical protein [bacterium]
MKTLEAQGSGGSVMETVTKYTGLALGVIGGLELAETTDSVLGKVFSVIGGAIAGTWLGKKAGQALN